MISQVKIVILLRVLLASIGLATDYILHIYYGGELKGEFNHLIYMTAVGASILSMGMEYKMHDENNFSSVNPYQSLFQLTALIFLIFSICLLLNNLVGQYFYYEYTRYLVLIMILEMYNTHFMHIFLRQKYNLALFVIRFNRRIMFLLYVTIAPLFLYLNLVSIIETYFIISLVTLMTYTAVALRFDGFKAFNGSTQSSVFRFVSLKGLLLKFSEILASKSLFLLLFLQYEDMEKGYLGSLLLLHESQMMIAQSFFVSKISTKVSDSNITLSELMNNEKKLLFVILSVFIISPILFLMIYPPTKSFDWSACVLMTIYSMTFSVLLTQVASVFSVGNLISSSKIFTLLAFCNCLSYILFDDFSLILCVIIFQHVGIIAALYLYNSDIISKSN